jgi:hypothetical protein
VQLQWRGERVAFIKGWSEFAQKSEMTIDDTIVFIPMDGSFDVQLYRSDTSVASIWGCKKHHHSHWKILVLLAAI